MTFYWHDYETFGVNPSKDRPSQFAGIRTDDEFNILGEPLVLFCKPSFDTLPSPMACIITGITPQQALEKGVRESEFIAKIHGEMSLSDTCSVGYNSLRFDDEVTRYALYRNFYDPYAREWQNGCSRWDIIDLVRMTYALRPDGMEWPCNENGHPSFRLELLTKANNIAHEAAHDALSDVYATIELAKLIKQKQPKLFTWLFDHRGKNQILNLIDVRGKKPFLHTTRMYPAENGCTSLVAPLIFERRNKSSLLVYDLRYSPEEFLNLEAAELKNRLFTPLEELPEGVNRLPVKSLKINKCPAIAPVSILTGDVATRIHINPDICAKNRECLISNPAFSERVREAYESQEFQSSGDVDSALYDGFFGAGDKKQIERVRQSSGAELSGAVFNFSDSRLEELLFRYRARNWPESLSEDERGRWIAHCENRYQNEETGLERYFAELASLRIKYGEDHRTTEVIDALEDWGDSLLGS